MTARDGIGRPTPSSDLHDDAPTTIDPAVEGSAANGVTGNGVPRYSASADQVARGSHASKASTAYEVAAALRAQASRAAQATREAGPRVHDALNTQSLRLRPHRRTRDTLRSAKQLAAPQRGRRLWAPRRQWRPPLAPHHRPPARASCCRRRIRPNRRPHPRMPQAWKGASNSRRRSRRSAVWPRNTQPRLRQASIPIRSTCHTWTWPARWSSRPRPRRICTILPWPRRRRPIHWRRW